MPDQQLDRERLHDVVALIHRADKPSAGMTRALLEAARNAHVKSSVIDALALYGSIIAEAEQAATVAKEAKSTAKEQWAMVQMALSTGPDLFDSETRHADH